MKIITEQERYNIVVLFARALHKDQVDKVGEPYFQHLERVANRGKTISEKIVGLLHDCTEDGHIKFWQLKAMGIFTQEELDAIYVLDKNNRFEGEAFEDAVELVNKGSVDTNKRYMNRILTSRLATTVKIYDTEDNSDVSRFLRNGLALEDKDKERMKKYERNLSYLKSRRQ